MMGVMV
jgi:hypothetical protein